VLAKGQGLLREGLRYVAGITKEGARIAWLHTLEKGLIVEWQVGLVPIQDMEEDHIMAARSQVRQMIGQGSA
jgi:hypothetical protein